MWSTYIRILPSKIDVHFISVYHISLKFIMYRYSWVDSMLDFHVILLCFTDSLFQICQTVFKRIWRFGGGIFRSIDNCYLYGSAKSDCGKWYIWHYIFLWANMIVDLFYIFLGHRWGQQSRCATFSCFLIGCTTLHLIFVPVRWTNDHSIWKDLLFTWAMFMVRISNGNETELTIYANGFHWTCIGWSNLLECWMYTWSTQEGILYQCNIILNQILISPFFQIINSAYSYFSVLCGFK